MTCTQCGYLLDGFEEACPRCGAAPPPRPQRRLTDRMPEMEEAAAGDATATAVKKPRKRAIDIGNVLPEHISLDQALKFLRPRSNQAAPEPIGREVLDLDSAAPHTLERGGQDDALPGVVWAGPERRARGCPGCGNPRQHHVMEIHWGAGPAAALQLDRDSQALLKDEFSKEMATHGKGIDLGGPAQPTETEVHLARQLAPPRPPRYQPSALARVAWAIAVAGLIALARLHQHVHATTTILCLIIIAGVIAMGVMETNKKERGFEAAVEAWRASCRRWRDTLYCERCEIVYNQSTGQRAGTESLLKIL